MDWTPVVVTAEILVALGVVLSRAGKLADRLVTLKEQQARPKPTPESVSIPEDLIAKSGEWVDSWARESERKRLREMYADLGDWDLVRAAIAAEK